MNPVTVILPTYNEKENIIPLIHLINRAFAPAEIIVIDDNSSDGTYHLLLDQHKKITNVIAIRNIPSLGLRGSIQKGITKAKNKIVAWMDADFSHPPEVLNDFYKQMDQADIVVGSWLIHGGKDCRKEKIDVLRSFLVNRLCRMLFGNEINAYTSGFTMVRKSVFRNFQLKGDYGEYFIDFIVRNRNRGKKIIEVPFRCYSRKAGISKTSPNFYVLIRRSFGYISMIISLAFLKQCVLLVFPSLFFYTGFIYDPYFPCSLFLPN